MSGFDSRRAIFALSLVSIGQSLVIMDLRWPGWLLMAAGIGGAIAVLTGPRRPGPRT